MSEPSREEELERNRVLDREYDALVRALRNEKEKARLGTEPYKTRWQKILEFFGIT